MAYISIEISKFIAEIGTVDGSKGTAVGLTGQVNWRTSIRDKANHDIGSAPWEVQVVPEAQISEISKESGAIGVCSYHERIDHPEHGSPAVFSAHVGLPPTDISDLLCAWSAGKAISSITLEIDDLEYGWEPDGSGKVWDTEIKHRTVRNARILIKDATPQADENEEDLIAVPAPDVPTKRDLRELGAQLKSIEKATHYILAAVVFAAFVLAFR